jgi:aarF domain-containing kinase
LEGIALVGNPDFAIVDEAYPYIAQVWIGQTLVGHLLNKELEWFVHGTRTGLQDAFKYCCDELTWVSFLAETTNR